MTTYICIHMHVCMDILYLYKFLRDVNFAVFADNMYATNFSP